MQGFIFKHKKSLYIIAILVIVVIIGISAFFIIQDRTNSATVKITVSPLTAKVKIGEKECDATSDCKVLPGEYDVLISAEGFIAKNGKLKALADEAIELAVYLEPTVENANWYEEHPQDATVRGDIINNAAIQNFYDLKEVEPILEYIPYNAYLYYIGYEENCAENNGKMCLTFKGDFGNVDTAVRYLQNTNQDLSRYVLKKSGGELFRNMEVVVPESLEFSAEDVSIDLASEITQISKAAESFAIAGLSNNEYTAEILQIKAYGNFCGVKIKVYQKNSGSEVFDTYRMILYKNNGEWIPITNLGIILSQYVDEKVPVELLSLVNVW